MKIKKITLFNVGPYIDKNTFDLSIRKDKNIVLIGGRNGAGKTTFFKAIKTCLYGCKVWGFDAPGKEYYSIINSLVNMKMQYDNSVKAYVELELIFDDGKQINSYVLHREWVKTKKAVSEKFTIIKDGTLLEGDEQADFINYLLSLIPPDMFNFYFFDGESIADFFLGNNGGKNFKNAFLKLYGLDTLSLMVENFERYYKKKEGNNAAFDIHKKAKEALSQYYQDLEILREKKRELEDKIDLIQIKLQTLQKEYTQEGGISLSEWKEINIQQAKEESRREELNRWLKETANHQLPFVILGKEMKNLLYQLEETQRVKKGKILCELLSQEEFKEKFNSFLIAEGINGDIDKIIQFVCKETLNEEQQVLFDLSDSQYNKLISQIYGKLEFEPTEIKKAIKELNASLKTSKELRERMLASSIDGFEEYSEKKEKLEKELLELTVALEKVSQEVIAKELEESTFKGEFEKARGEYEKLLKSKSVNEMSMRAIAAYSLLEEKLITKQGKLLQEEFIMCFNAIINKENFLDGIVIDSNINVIPYKFVDVSFLQIENYMKENAQTKFLSLFENKYLEDVNNLRLGLVDSIRLPAPIKAPFSQGERQVYIMSIYLALLKTSRKDIPFFIDTPFARIDSKHRGRIVEEFFNVIPNQMFILSTDEEIVGEYEQMMNKKVADKFMLNINNYGNTTVVASRYFEV